MKNLLSKNPNYIRCIKVGLASAHLVLSSCTIHSLYIWNGECLLFHTIVHRMSLCLVGYVYFYPCVMLLWQYLLQYINNWKFIFVHNYIREYFGLSRLLAYLALGILDIYKLLDSKVTCMCACAAQRPQEAGSTWPADRQTSSALSRVSSLLNFILHPPLSLHLSTSLSLSGKRYLWYRRFLADSLPVCIPLIRQMTIAHYLLHYSCFVSTIWIFRLHSLCFNQCFNQLSVYQDQGSGVCLLFLMQLFVVFSVQLSFQWFRMVIDPRCTTRELDKDLS